jgi:hypothetical protein
VSVFVGVENVDADWLLGDRLSGKLAVPRSGARHGSRERALEQQMAEPELEHCHREI